MDNYMNDFNKYFYIYVDSQGNYKQALNPLFIAKHNCCRAVSKEEVLHRYGSCKRLLERLNENIKTHKFLMTIHDMGLDI